MRTKGTLVILTPGFAANEADSTCLPMQQSFVRTIVEKYRHVKVVVISFHYPYATGEYQWHGLSVFSFNGQNRGGIRRLFIRRKVMACLRQLHRTERLIGLLSFWYNECAAVGEKFGRENGVNHFCWLLGQDARAGNKYVRSVSISPDHLIALSDFIRAEFRRNYRMQPVNVIPPGINPGHYQTSNSAKDIDLIGVGSLIPLKQYDQFILAVAEIRKSFPFVRAVLVGEGPEKSKLQQMIRKHSLQNNLQLVGECSHGDVTQFMNRSKVFLHPSSYEGFGVVCLEALYSGAQVVSYVQPMEQRIDGWHIVGSLQEMVQQSISILQASSQYEQKLVVPMDETVGRIMQLFSVDKGFATPLNEVSFSDFEVRK